MRLGALFVEAASSILREARRVGPMAIGIVWGVASVFVLVAVARGFEAHQRRSLEALGEHFLLLRVNKPMLSRGDDNDTAFIRLDRHDLAAVREGASSIAAVSPKAFDWRARAFRDGERTRSRLVGVLPEYADICHIPLAPGSRWLDDHDVQHELPVTVIGPRTKRDLFGDENPLGQDIQAAFRSSSGEGVMRRLTVVGYLRDEELAGDGVYLSHESVMFVPFPVFERMSARGYTFFVVRPRVPEERDAAVAEVRHILGRRRGFDGDDPNTLIPYFDAFERGQQIDAVFGGLRFFLTAVGALILLLGAVGVANVVLMSVTARTFEFALRRALGCKRRWIFGQVFLEASLVCVVSGLVGFGLGAAGVAAMGFIDLPAGFAAPEVEWGSAVLPGVLLLFVSLGAAAWPATRAARVTVVQALHGGGL